MNSTTQIKIREYKQIFRSAVRLMIGGTLGAAAYILFAKIVMDQPYVACSPKLAHSLVEASYFPTRVLISPILHPASMFYQPLQYLLASIPYAVPGALPATGAKKVMLLAAGSLTVSCLCGSWLIWAIITSTICA